MCIAYKESPKIQSAFLLTEIRASCDWEILAQFLSTLAVVWMGFRLSFWRTVLVVILFWGPLAGIYLLARGGLAGG